MPTALLVALLVVAIVTPSAWNAPNSTARADVNRLERGLSLARRLCAGCHSVEREQTTSPVQDATAFQVMGSRQGTTAIAIRSFIYGQHRIMPNIIVSQNEIDSIAEYILSLAPK